MIYVNIIKLVRWRSGLTLRFAKPPFAGSTPARTSNCDKIKI